MDDEASRYSAASVSIRRRGAAVRSTTGSASDVLRTTILTVVTGGVTFLVTNALNQPQAISILLSILVGGIALLARFLVLFEGRQDSVEEGLALYAEEVRRLATQRDDEIRQTALLVRYVEEQIPRVIADKLNLKQQDEPLVRELAHSLNTPLAQMEATLLTHVEAVKDDRDVEDLLTGIRICKSFLAAFRELATLSRDTYVWEPDSISEAVQAAARLYIARASVGIGCEVDLPDTVAGYGNNYIIALLLPLLENAIEASPVNGKVTVSLGDADSEYLFDIGNDRRAGESMSPLIYKTSWSSKPGHEGLGLATVQNLLATYRGAVLNHRVDESRVTFRVQLPRSASQ